MTPSWPLAKPTPLLPGLRVWNHFPLAICSPVVLSTELYLHHCSLNDNEMEMEDSAACKASRAKPCGSLAYMPSSHWLFPAGTQCSRPLFCRATSFTSHQWSKAALPLLRPHCCSGALPTPFRCSPMPLTQGVPSVVHSSWKAGIVHSLPGPHRSGPGRSTWR